MTINITLGLVCVHKQRTDYVHREYDPQTLEQADGEGEIRQHLTVTFDRTDDSGGRFSIEVPPDVFDQIEVNGTYLLSIVPTSEPTHQP